MEFDYKELAKKTACDLCGKEGNIHNPHITRIYPLGGNWPKDIHGSCLCTKCLAGYCDGKTPQEEYVSKVITTLRLRMKPSKVCECGGDKANTTHSIWCPKYA